MRFSRPAHSRSRSTNFWTLPVEVFGSSPNSTASGHLKCAMRSRQKRDDLLARWPSAPGLSVTNAFGPLAPLLVGDGDDGALQHGGVAGDRLLDLDGRDVLAAGDDDVLLAVAQLDVAVGCQHAEVAGVEPAAAEGLGGRLGLVRSSPSSRCCRASPPRPSSRRRAARRASRSSTTRTRSASDVALALAGQQRAPAPRRAASSHSRVPARRR